MMIVVYEINREAAAALTPSRGIKEMVAIMLMAAVKPMYFIFWIMCSPVIRVAPVLLAT